MEQFILISSSLKKKSITQSRRTLYWMRRLFYPSTTPIFPTKIEVLENKTLFYADDNYFFLSADTCRELSVEIRVKDESLKSVTLELSAWNAEAQSVIINL